MCWRENWQHGGATGGALNTNGGRAGVHTQAAPRHIAHTVFTTGRATITALSQHN